MVRTLADLNNQRGPNNPAGNPLNMGRMGQNFDWTTIPSCFYVIGLTMTIMFFLTALTGLGLLLVNVPIVTVLHLQVWRVLLTYFVVDGIFSLLIAYLVLFSLSMTEEPDNGSGRFFLQVFKRNLAVQLLVCVFGVLLYFAFGITKIISYGIWPVYFTYLTERCLENPDGVTYFCMMPCPIKNKYYPLVLLLIFTILFSGGGLPIDIWLAFALAHLCKRRPAVKRYLEPSLAWSQRFQRYLSVFDGKLGKLAPLQNTPEPREGPLDNHADPNAPGASTNDIVKKAFVGGGVRIGGTSNSNSIYQNYDHLDKQTMSTGQPDPNVNSFEEGDSNITQEISPERTQDHQPVPIATPQQKAHRNDDSL